MSNKPWFAEYPRLNAAQSRGAIAVVRIVTICSQVAASQGWLSVTGAPGGSRRPLTLHASQHRVPGALHMTRQTRHDALGEAHARKRSSTSQRAPLSSSSDQALWMQRLTRSSGPASMPAATSGCWARMHPSSSPPD